jgi:hypothetical protein
MIVYDIPHLRPVFCTSDEARNPRTSRTRAARFLPWRCSVRAVTTLVVIAAAVAVVPTVCFAQVGPGELVVIGAGWVGDWDTEIQLADAPLAGGTQGSISKFVVTIQPCTDCGTSFDIPENGTARYLASEILGPSFEGPQLLRVFTLADQALPITRARIFRRSLPCQSADLPVLRESTLRAADTGTLVFPGLVRDAATRSNLILQLVGTESGVDVTIDAYDAGGALIGSTTARVPPEAAFQALTLVDVVALLGGDQIEGGRLVVTRTSGGGVVWGVLATYAQDGALTMSGGLNP